MSSASLPSCVHLPLSSSWLLPYLFCDWPRGGEWAGRHPMQSLETAARPTGPTPGSPAYCPLPSLVLFYLPGRGQVLCDAPVAMVILDEKAIMFWVWNFHPLAHLFSTCSLIWFSTRGLENMGSATINVFSAYPSFLRPPFNPNRDPNR